LNLVKLEFFFDKTIKEQEKGNPKTIRKRTRKFEDSPCQKWLQA
jgi:hypothetical protein